MMIELIALTMMCDANRVIILQWPGFVTFNFDGIAHMYDHHGLSHRNGTSRRRHPHRGRRGHDLESTAGTAGATASS